MDGCAASLREGMEETLTVKRLGLQGRLKQTLATTNPIENLHGRLVLKVVVTHIGLSVCLDLGTGQ